MSLSQIMEEQNKQSELEMLSTSIQDLKNSLTESIQNVLNVQLKKLWDHQENQLKEITREFKMDIEVYQKRAEFQTELTIERIQQDTLDKFNKIYKTNTNNLTKASANLKKLSMKNVLMNFVCAIILVMATIGGVLYVANYRDGSEIAAAKAEERVAAALEGKQIVKEIYNNGSSVVGISDTMDMADNGGN